MNPNAFSAENHLTYLEAPQSPSVLQRIRGLVVEAMDDAPCAAHAGLWGAERTSSVARLNQARKLDAV